MVLAHAGLLLEAVEFMYQVTVSLAIFVSLDSVAALLAVSVPLGLVVAVVLVSFLEFDFPTVSSPGVTAILAVYRPRNLFR